MKVGRSQTYENPTGSFHRIRQRRTWSSYKLQQRGSGEEKAGGGIVVILLLSRSQLQAQDLAVTNFPRPHNW